MLGMTAFVSDSVQRVENTATHRMGNIIPGPSKRMKVPLVSLEIAWYQQLFLREHA